MKDKKNQSRKKKDESVMVLVEEQTPAVADVPTPMSLIQMAVTKGVDVAQLEKLMDLQERWEKEQARKLFFKSLGQFQSECPVLKKKKQVAFTTREGGKTAYNYATLGDIVEQIRPIMRKYGLSHRWEMKDEGAAIHLTCLISHESGHIEKTSMSAEKDTSGKKNDIQSRGSTVTYLQRYTLIGALGISTADEDNDANKKDPEKKQADPFEVYRIEVAKITDTKGLQKYYEANSDMHSVKGFNAIFNSRKLEIEKQKK